MKLKLKLRFKIPFEIENWTTLVYT
jgi:hypothetical protein